MRHEKLFRTALEPLSIEMGVRVGNYTLIDELGRGGSAVVWLAVQDHLGREVALKVLGNAGPAANWGGSARQQARFHREVEVATMLDHPNIAHVYDSGFNDSVPYLVMEYIDGQALDAYVNESGLTREQIVVLVKTIAEGLQHAHQRGVIHRDLKPSNILVTREGRPVIVDFGLAKALDSGDVGAAGAEVSLDGELVGTPAYMAPEQARGESRALDSRVDVYALGVILYQLLTGHLPHDAEGTSIEVLRRICETDIRRPTSVEPTLAGDLEAVLLMALAKDPGERYASAGEMAEDLGRYLDHRPLRARPANGFYFFTKHLRRHWATWTAVGLGLFVISAATARYVYETQRFAETEQQLRRTLALEASDAEFRSAEVVAEETDWTLGILATALEQNPDNLAASTLAGMLLKQSAQILPLSLLPPHGPSKGQDFRFAEAAPVYGAHDGLRAMLYSEDTSEPVSPNLIHASPITAIEIAASGATLVTRQENGDLSVWSQHREWQASVVSVAESAKDLQISPDGRWVAWTTPDNSVFLWDWQAGTPGRLVPTESQRVHWGPHMARSSGELLFDPQSRYLLVKKGEHSAMLWNLESRGLCGVLEDASHGANPPAALCYQFSPDGQQIAACHPGMPFLGLYHLSEETLALETSDVLEPRVLQNAQGFTAAAFLPSSDSLVVAGSREVIKADIDARMLRDLTPEGLYWPHAMSLSGDGRVLAVTGAEVSATLLDTQSGERITSIDHAWGVQKLALNHPATRLALVDGRGKLSVWDAQTGRKLGMIDSKLRGMAPGPKSLAFSATGNHLWASTSDGRTHAWRLQEASLKPRVLAYDEPFLACVLSPDTRSLIASTSKEAFLWDTLAGEPLLGPLPHASASEETGTRWDFSFRREASFDPLGDAFYLRKTNYELQRYLLDGSPSGPGMTLGFSYGTLFVAPAHDPVVCSATTATLTVWEPSSGKVRWQETCSKEQVWPSLSSRGSYLLTGTTVRIVEIRDMASGKLIHEMIPHHGWLTDVAWSPDEALLATASETTEVKLFSTGDWKELATFGHQGSLTRVVFHPNKPMLLSAAKDGTVALWDVECFSSFGRSMDHDSAVVHASFSRDGHQIATACQDGTVHLWDTATQRRLCRPIPHPGPVTKVAFHAESTHLITLCDDGNVRVWPIFIANSPAPPWFPGLLRGISGSEADLASWFQTPHGRPVDRYSRLTKQCLGEITTP